MPTQPSDPRVLESWPEEFAALPFGSPAFKAANARLADEDEATCAPFARAMPPWINLTSTTVCNLKCFMCNQSLDPDSPKWIMEDAVYERVVRELYPYARTMQLSAFGEPLMTPGIDRKLDDLEAHGVKLDMVSNGTLMMKESRFREQLLRNLEEVTFSLDGATAETYESVRIGAHFAEVHDNISRFAEARMAMPVERRPKLYFNYILMKRTIAEAPSFVEQVKRWGGDGITFNHLVSFHPSLRAESLNYHRAYCNEWLDRTRAALAAFGVPAALPPNFALTESEPVAPATAAPPPAPRQRTGPPPKKCMFLWRRIYVGPNGDVVPCNLAGMPNFGNLAKERFFDIWNGETYRDYRAHVFTERQLGKCRNCYQVWQTPELAGAEGFEY